MKKSNLIDILIISVIGIFIVLFFARYITNKDFRNFVDIKVLGKQILENSVNSIEINADDNPKYFAYDNHIGIISKNKLYSKSILYLSNT